MAARAQIEVRMFPNSVYLYTHWGSYELPQDLALILNSSQARDRWDDPEYLTRIIFENMIRDNLGSSTGYGISTFSHGDLDYDPILVDPETKTVVHKNYSYSFQEFIDAFLFKAAQG